jgi:hypothetical protein
MEFYMNHTFRKIATSTAIAATLAIASTASFAQEYPQQNQPTVQQDAPHVSGADAAKNIGFGAVAGAIFSKVINASAERGAITGAVVGLGKTIYDDMQIKKEAEARQATNPKPQVQPVAQGQGSPVVDAAGNTVVIKTMHTALMDRVDGKTPNPTLKRLSDGSMELQGQSVQDVVYGLGSVLQAKHKIRLDIVSTEAASLRQQSAINERVSVKFNPDSLQSTMNALYKVAQDMDMGVMYEDKTNYIVLANKQMVRDLVGNPALQRVAQTSGITSGDVDEVLKNYRPRTQVQVQPGFQPNPNYQAGSARYSYSEMSERERQRGFRY